MEAQSQPPGDAPPPRFCRTCQCCLTATNGIRCVKCHRALGRWLAAGCPDNGRAYEPRFDGVRVTPDDVDLWDQLDDVRPRELHTGLM